MLKRGWYCKLRGRSRGPVSPETLRELAHSGRLRPTDMISRDGTTNWIRAGNVKHLFKSSARSAPSVLDRGPDQVYFGPSVAADAGEK